VAAAADRAGGRAASTVTVRTTRVRVVTAKIAWPKSGHGSRLGAKRWVVERTIAWLHQYRRLRIRYERRDDIHEAFLAIGCSLICLKLLQPENSF
jgi:transposase